jgi:hypothetical protein
MQLRNARLCLDCEEVHDAAHCPACASESFAFITRWVPSPSADGTPAQAPAVPVQPDPSATSRTERRERPEASLEPATRETLDTYRQLLNGRSSQPSQWRFVKHGAVGLALFGLAGWAWKQQAQRPPAPEPTDDPDSQD